MLRGAKTVQQQLPSSVPQMLLFTRPGARARPSARRLRRVLRRRGAGLVADVMWSFQTLERDLGLNQALQIIKRRRRQVTDRRPRSTFNRRCKHRTADGARAGTSTRPLRPRRRRRPPQTPARPRPVSDRTAVAPAPQTRVLAEQAPRLSPDAIVQVGSEERTHRSDAQQHRLHRAGADEWLTVAARDSGDRLSANEIYDFVTIQLRSAAATSRPSARTG